MKKNIFHYIGFLNYGCTWLGIARIIIAIVCVYSFFGLLQSEEPLPLRIFGCVLISLSAFGCLVTGIPNIKEGIENRRSYERQLKYDMEAALKEKNNYEE